MTIRNILAAYGGKAAAGSGLRHAIKLAKHHDAWLTGAVSHGPSLLEARYGGQMHSSVLAELRKLDEERVKSIRLRFDEAVSALGDPSRASFVDLDHTGTPNLAVFARSFDLVVMGNHSDAPSEAQLSAYPDQVALQSGRPVLIVPDGYDENSLADHALVAWDGKRAAARALGDAMQVLEEKSKVTVLTVGTAPADVDVLMTNLERHGINAEHVNRPRGKSVGATIQETAAEISAKLIVMGAFEHSKFSHDVFGGVTTDVIRNAETPVFMSH